MRVIAGQFRSRRLKGPGTLRLRPTSDRLREALFNILGPAVSGSFFIDLYAGTGAVGIEALSRGAQRAVFVESHKPSARLIRENLLSLGITAGAEILECSVLTALQALAARGLAADFIFLDPPYAEPDESLRVLDLLGASRLFAPHGLLIAEHSRKTALPGRVGCLERARLLAQGDASLSFYRLAAAG